MKINKQNKKYKLVRHETLIPEDIKKFVRSLKAKGYGSESVITTVALRNLKESYEQDEKQLS